MAGFFLWIHEIFVEWLGRLVGTGRVGYDFSTGEDNEYRMVER